jgi:hypothetical protein
MTSFRTEVNPASAEQKISYQDNVLLIGSCFSENIGSKFAHFGFNSLTNPFGVVFNPVSIASLLQRMLDNKLFVEEDFQFDQGRWFCFETHGDIAALTKEECLQKHNEVLTLAFEFLKKTNRLIITLGSAWVYEHIETGNLVANCHKVPNTQFRKRLLSIEEVVGSFNKLIKNLKLETSNVQLTFTLSPVRHWKDGVVENQRSKSLLHLAIQQLVEECESASYFPAYEIMMDDLRDYRFYKEDMLHPNQQAVDYIWEKFKNSSIDESCSALMGRVDKARSSLAHRPFNEYSEAYRKFKLKLDSEIEQVNKELNGVSLSENQ